MDYDGTDQIADRFSSIGTQGPTFEPPIGAAINWLPRGYKLVVDPGHIIKPDDCVIHHLSNDWRMVRDINQGERVGRYARDIGGDIRYVATKN